MIVYHGCPLAPLSTSKSPPMPVNPNEVVIDLGRDGRLTRHALETLQDRYLVGDEKSPQEAFARACAAFGDDAAHANRLYSYVTRGWFMFATPLLSNGGTGRGLPISCFLNYMPDSRTGIIAHYEETAMLSSVGGGVGAYIGDLRSLGTSTSKGSATSGALAFTVPMDRWILAFSQGKTRRGSYAAYLDVSHPEIEEWLEMRKPSGGDANRKALNLHNAVNLTDDFMKAVRADAMFPLVDPKTKQVTKEVHARTLFRKMVEVRKQTGEPYMVFIDTINDALPQPLKDLGLKVHHSNLCTEITLPTNEDRTAVCCLSSLNLAAWDEWKDDPQFIEDLFRMLDNALQDFIDNAPPELWRAVNSARSERSVGLGAMGWHTFLQDRLIAWDSPVARGWNLMIFEHIRKLADKASLVLGAERGEAPDMAGTGERFAHKLALAPNASSSIFLNISPATEQWPGNFFVHKTLTGSHNVKNPSLQKLLASKGLDTTAIWEGIIETGSVQHLTEELTDHERRVFLTAFETDQRSTLLFFADRAPLIDQAQSLNLFIPAVVDADYLMELHFRAWELGIKSLYYLRSQTAQKGENVNNKVERIHLVADNDTAEPETCLACEG